MGNGQTISVANEGELLLLVKRSLPSRGGGREGGWFGERVRERERAQTDTQKHRQTDAQTVRRRETKIDRRRERDTEGERD